MQEEVVCWVSVSVSLLQPASRQASARRLQRVPRESDMCSFLQRPRGAAARPFVRPRLILALPSRSWTGRARALSSGESFRCARSVRTRGSSSVSSRYDAEALAPRGLGQALVESHELEALGAVVGDEER